jgi:hypothetical protein
MKATYTASEKEAIGLCIALEAAGDLANHSLLDLREGNRPPYESEVYFHSHVHQQLFLIRLLDFAKEGGDSKLTGISGSCLEVLRVACKTKSFDKNDSVAELAKAVDELSNWLSYEASIKLWLPTLDINATIKISRLDFLNISGNQSKHNISRLSGVSKSITNILKNSGYEVPIAQVPLALDDFSEHLDENYFVYYGTWLAELVNNIIWGVRAYLRPVFAESFRPDGSGSLFYEYVFPAEIQDSIARQWFWRLMNHVRSKPYLNKFIGAHYLKERSSLEWHQQR